jgi:hypothetical protein
MNEIVNDIDIKKILYTPKQKQYIKTYRLKNNEALKTKDKNYRDLNKDIIKMKRDERTHRNKNDPEYKIKMKELYETKINDPSFIAKRKEYNMLYRLKQKELKLQAVLT